MATDYTATQCLHDFWTLLEGRRARFLLFTAIRATAALAPFGIAYALGRIVDFFTLYTGGPLSKFYFFAASMAVLGFLQVYLRWVGKHGIMQVAGKVRSDTRIRAMKKLMELDLRWHEGEQTGSKIERVNDGVNKVLEGFRLWGNDGIRIPVTIIAALIAYIALGWKYATFGLLYSVIYLVMEWRMNHRIKSLDLGLRKKLEVISGKIHEGAANIMAIQSLGLQANVLKEIGRKENELYDLFMQAKTATRTKAVLLKGFAAIGYAAFVIVMGFDVVSGVMTVGLMYVYASYFGKLREGLDTITNYMGNWITIQNSVGRLMSLLALKSRTTHDGVSIPIDWETMSFNNVTMRYGADTVLENFSLQIHRNESLGIVGRSGCGKSTLIKALLGLYTVESGSITIDGTPLQNFSRDSISTTIGVVLQDSEVFNISLGENIALSGDYDEMWLQRVIDASQISSLAASLPEGISTIIGERGYKLSGGERQRVGLARALYKQTPVLILDEATSHLDSTTEREIQRHIDVLEDTTLIVIAHRLSTLKNVDRIIVMENGKIIEEGTFSALLSQEGVFSELYARQLNTTTETPLKNLRTDMLEATLNT